MGFYCEVANPCLIKELRREIGDNVLLLTVDGFAIYGKLQDIEDNRIAILAPPSNLTGIVIRRPDGGIFVQQVFTYVDLFTVVAKNTGLPLCPFVDCTD